MTRTTLLKYASAMIVGFGLLFFLSLISPIAALLDLFVDLAYLPYDGIQSATSEPAQLLTAIAGGMLTGWGADVLAGDDAGLCKRPGIGKINHATINCCLVPARQRRQRHRRRLV